jgi:hypothetical protein
MKASRKSWQLVGSMLWLLFLTIFANLWRQKSWRIRIGYKASCVGQGSWKLFYFSANEHCLTTLRIKMSRKKLFVNRFLLPFVRSCIARLVTFASVNKSEATFPLHLIRAESMEDSSLFISLKLSPYTLAGFDLTTHSSSLLEGWRRWQH